MTHGRHIITESGTNVCSIHCMMIIILIDFSHLHLSGNGKAELRP